MRKCIFSVVLAMVAGMLSVAASAAGAQAAVPQYLSGGVGEEELAQMQQASASYNLRLLFAEKSGAYVADVRAVIADAEGRKLVELAGTGPYLFVNLPAGKYRVGAEYAGRMIEQTVEIRAGAAQERIFRW